MLLHLYSIQQLYEVESFIFELPCIFDAPHL
jgi:hypothetical protein